MISDTEEKEEENDLYRQMVKAHSVELSRLAATVESLQSQINQLEEAMVSSSMKTKKESKGKKKKKSKL